MNLYSKKNNTEFRSIKVEDGVIKFEGSVPSSLERVKK
jgi:hypothetical protein